MELITTEYHCLEQQKPCMVYIPARSSKQLPMTICSDKNFANIAKRSHFWIFALQPLFSNYVSDPLEVELVSWLELVRNPRPFPSVFAYCKQSNTESGEGLRTRNQLSLTYQPHTYMYIIYYSHGTMMCIPPKCLNSLLEVHPISSLPSVQSRNPSQRSVLVLTHWPLLHRNAPLPQETVQIIE